MDKGVTVIVPVLDRIDNWEPLVKSINDNTNDAYIIFVRSPGLDKPKTALLDIFNKYDNTDIRRNPSVTGPGDYAKKINLVAPFVFTEWFLCGADDLKFHPNWFENAMKVATDEVHVIGTNDLGNPRVLEGRHSTHSLIRTEYVKEYGLTADCRVGEVLHTGYWHEYVDDELCGVAQKRNIWAFAQDCIIEHLHPHWGKAEYDESYNQQSMRMTYSRSLFLSRKKLWT